MRKAKRSLEVRDGLIWVDAVLTTATGFRRVESLVLDTGTAHTSLSIELANELGFDKSKKRGVARYDTAHGPVRSYTVRLPEFSFMGKEVQGYLVGCQIMSKRLHVPGILGLDFFLQTDLRLAFLEKLIYLSW